jgi:hypothetical protein
MKMMADAKTETAKTDKPMKKPVTFRLKRSGVTVVYDRMYSAREAIAAQKAAGKDSSAFVVYLAQSIATFDGERLTAGEILERVPGADFLQLTGEILGDDEPAEGEAGN